MTRTLTCWIVGCACLIRASSSCITYRRRADQAADSANITSVCSRSTTPERRGVSSAGRFCASHCLQKLWRLACSETRVNVGVDRPRTALTESGLRNVFETFVAELREPPRLSRRSLLGILNSLILGKPAERWGRKATGLKRGAMTAGLPARCKLFISLIQRKQGAERPGYCRAVICVIESRLRRFRGTASKRRDFCSLVTRLLPIEAGFCTSHPERTA